ncbi:TPA: hypothetical protein HA338_06185 [Methanosarcina acetivorans]|uniref:Uncharacterized protein n=2 Tax=Methanosarcina acetivorans TaxID=2214 RepID=Q8TJG0_METAC|nr:hypothetical protein [Methanosarcina acetivorans]AAM07176.1 predicted protein [Methanosarcina acetivorans C2A]HIH93629.1 hypothetical protein [Methanosarcina acetivorans]
MTIFESFSLEDILAFGAGLGAFATTLYLYARRKGFKLLSTELEQLPAQLEIAQESLETLKNEINTAKGNISLAELADIVYTAEQYSKGGFTAAEAETLGKKIIDAAASK